MMIKKIKQNNLTNAFPEKRSRNLMLKNNRLKQSRPQQENDSAPRGFTLIELLISMTIIAVLIALLLPAINGAIQRGRDGQVKTEIGQFDAALAAFKAKYGQFPPSNITLYLGTANWDADPESKALIRSFWPEFDFSINTTGDTTTDVPWADGTTLNGAECLVFFLGGVNDAAGSKNLIGFSKDPINPFSRSGSNRHNPLFEFQADRLQVNGQLTYIDPLPGQDITKPYLYISSEDGVGYNTADFNGAMTNVYTQTGGGDWKKASYQIISPGQDGQYGVGGIFSVDTSDSDLTGAREDERDNITNYHSGRLAP